MQRFTELKVWQYAHAITLAVYRVTRAFPAEERFHLTTQLRRAATSIPTNIAEGSKRRRPLDYARFLNISEGSLAETEYLIMLSRDLGYLTARRATRILQALDETARMLASLRRKVEADA